MTQSAGEQFTNFVSRLRAKARHCNFTFKCQSETCDHAENNYSVAMITDQMVIGLYDDEIQCEELSNDRTLQTFDSKFQFIKGLEKDRKTKNQLHKDTSTASTVKSQYQLEKNNDKSNESKRNMKRNQNIHHEQKQKGNKTSNKITLNTITNPT